MTRKLLDDCFLHDSERLRHSEALAILRARITPVVGTERIVLADAAGRVLAEAAIAAHPVPLHTNAAVDGYAFGHGAHVAGGADNSLAVIARAAAGHPAAISIGAGEAARIFTGAVMPDGTDTVAMQEDVEIGHGGAERVRIPGGLKRGANVRRAGEDVAAGSQLMAAGEVIRAQDASALASIGLETVVCFKRLRVAIVSTGDEVVRAGSGSLRHGQVFDANAPLLTGLISAAGAEVHDLGVWPDDAEIVRARLAAAARSYDVLLTTGGASRGEEDHMVAAIDAIGRRHLWQLAVKPGRPMSFGQIGDTVVLGLPGNPVAVFVCFLMYGFPLLRRLGGGAWREPCRYRVPAAFEVLRRKTGRREFWRGILSDGPEGLRVDKFARDGSGLISGLRAADGLIEVDEDAESVRAGDLVNFIPFSEFGILR